MFEIELPWPPSINNYWRHTRTGHYISRAGKSFRQSVSYLCFNAKDKFTEKDKLHIIIDAYPPDRRKRDLDNILKSLLDALQHAGVYKDDSQIDRLSISRKLPLEGKVSIEISVIP